MIKQWYDKDGKKVNTECIITNEGIFCNPEEEWLLANGFTFEWVTPPEKEIEVIRGSKLNELQAYDSSDNVNQFFFNNMPMWLGQTERTALMLRCQSCEQRGEETTTLWYSGFNVTIAVETLKGLLLQVEGYADECFDITQQHTNNIKALTTKEEIQGYDFKTNYPEKLHLSSVIEVKDVVEEEVEGVAEDIVENENVSE